MIRKWACSPRITGHSVIGLRSTPVCAFPDRPWERQRPLRLDWDLTMPRAKTTGRFCAAGSGCSTPACLSWAAALPAILIA